MDTPGTLPLDRKVIAPLGDVLNLSVVVKPEIDHPVGDGIVGSNSFRGSRLSHLVSSASSLSGERRDNGPVLISRLSGRRGSPIRS
jgi:hypothetical protein